MSTERTLATIFFGYTLLLLAGVVAVILLAQWPPARVLWFACSRAFQ